MSEKPWLSIAAIAVSVVSAFIALGAWWTAQEAQALAERRAVREALVDYEARHQEVRGEIQDYTEETRELSYRAMDCLEEEERPGYQRGRFADAWSELRQHTLDLSMLDYAVEHLRPTSDTEERLALEEHSKRAQAIREAALEAWGRIDHNCPLAGSPNRETAVGTELGTTEPD